MLLPRVPPLLTHHDEYSQTYSCHCYYTTDTTTSKSPPTLPPPPRARPPAPPPPYQHLTRSSTFSRDPKRSRYLYSVYLGPTVDVRELDLRYILHTYTDPLRDNMQVLHMGRAGMQLPQLGLQLCGTCLRHGGAFPAGGVLGLQHLLGTPKY